MTVHGSSIPKQSIMLFIKDYLRSDHNLMCDDLTKIRRGHNKIKNIFVSKIFWSYLELSGGFSLGFEELSNACFLFFHHSCELLHQRG